MSKTDWSIFGNERTELRETLESFICKIVSGEIPSAKVYEDDVCYAFDDIEPEAPVHTLIVPKTHYDNMAAGVPAEVIGHMM
ncbi:HIT domain-containing protein, partial [Adlercreutzia sp. DFI.6.23]|uniref:HIT domain-containing protein n=1 Tax=Adlercreutzia sp. DFI.6.23 TaxID=2963705 RepID=UPI00210EC5AC